jgi:hypothetical protein
MLRILSIKVRKIFKNNFKKKIFKFFLERGAYPSSTPHETYPMPTMTQYPYGQVPTQSPQGSTMQYYQQGQGYAPYSTKPQK